MVRICLTVFRGWDWQRKGKPQSMCCSFLVCVYRRSQTATRSFHLQTVMIVFIISSCWRQFAKTVVGASCALNQKDMKGMWGLPWLCWGGWDEVLKESRGWAGREGWEQFPHRSLFYLWNYVRCIQPRVMCLKTVRPVPLWVPVCT